MYDAIYNYCKTLSDDFSTISEARRTVLHQITDFAGKKLKNNQVITLNFICTHNSRRSQFGQIWAKVAADFYGFSHQLEVYSGGTEVTAFHINAVNTLIRLGFEMKVQENSTNPRYSCSFSKDMPPLFMFSKIYNDKFNPESDFAAVMVCSQADEACPFVIGAEKRFSLPFEDPKIADETPEETSTYNHACRLIAMEIFYVFSQVSSHIQSNQP
ncbi:MAG: protein-tyrosine-phosphatase [Verrucomicrobia bacterium]|nr:protein-tyrosine-phosphatase [Cytophagales bacterium]